MANKFNSEGYYSPTEFEVFTKIEKEEAAVRKAASFRPIVYICSPYAGNIYDNILKARKYSRFAVDCHVSPFPRICCFHSLWMILPKEILLSL